MGIPIKLPVFEGPLDLLLHLIDKNKINIYDIPIVEITDQYMTYIKAMQKQDLNVISEFLVMAATLLDIKSRMLLPKEINEDGEEEDPRQELVERLLEYKLYKFMSYELKDKQMQAGHFLYKPATIPKEVSNYIEPVDLQELLGDLNLSKLQKVFHSVIKKQEDKIDPVRSKFGRIEQEEVHLGEIMEYVEQTVLQERVCSFRKLLEAQSSKMKIIVTFLAVLELMKVGKINISQKEMFGDILITADHAA